MANIPKPQPDVMYVKRCRACSTSYDFELSPNVTVTVICGRPSKSQAYKAVSYLWENSSGVSVDLLCINPGCLAKKNVPVRDATKLTKILHFVSQSKHSCMIWLDALSIDQNDEADKLVQLKVMGDIYRHAEVVSVLLPVGDEEAYEKLRALSVVAQKIVDYERSGKLNQSELEDPDPYLVELFKVFENGIFDWAANLHKWKYWTRAWTFQEFTMASELEITCEIASHKEVMCTAKNIILMAGTIVGLGRSSQTLLKRRSADTLQNKMALREQNGSLLNEIRLHFPFSDALVADNELQGDDLRAHTFIPPTSAIDSGTYVTSEPPREKPLRMRTLLNLALNAFTMSKRAANFEADLVECWASMCNISYDYVKSDSVELTLHKVLSTLRKGGLKIYNWQVNTTAGVTDLAFMKYAAAMRQSNHSTRGLMFGSPVFTGRADTITHLKLCLEPQGEKRHFVTATTIKLQRVKGVLVKNFSKIGNLDETAQQLKAVVSGKRYKDRLTDVVPLMMDVVSGISPDQLPERALVIVSINILDGPSMDCFDAWALCPSSTERSQIFVARESLNGTLVLATAGNTKDGPAQIVAYLNMTHQGDGTYLIKSDDKGVVDIVFRALEDQLSDESWFASVLGDVPTGIDEGGLDFGMLDVAVDRSFNVRIGLEDDDLRVGL